MIAALPLPRLIFGAGALEALPSELSLLGVHRPLLLSDRGLERVGAVARAAKVLGGIAIEYLDVPENPTCARADAAYATYRDNSCDGVVALGGGSVIDTAKFVAALAAIGPLHASDLLGRPELISRAVAPLVAIPTTVGTGSESSPVSGLHRDSASPPIGTRSALLVPRLAICDPDLVRTLPARLIAATGIDALGHCIEGYFAEPANPIVDALALDGIARVYAGVQSAVQADGDAARASLMAAAFAGGAAIHKGLGPAHAIALAFGDQELHHGTLVAAALPWTTELIAPHAPRKAAQIAAAMGLRGAHELGAALRALTRALGLPSSLRSAGYRVGSIDQLVANMRGSHFNRSSPYVPTAAEYLAIAQHLLA